MIKNHVSFGGGLGTRLMIEALVPFSSRHIGVVAVTDSGRSTRVARRDFHIPGPGDVANVIFDLCQKYHPDAYIRELARYLQLRPYIDGSEFNDCPPRNFLIGTAGQADAGKISPIVRVLNQVFLPKDFSVFNISDADTHLEARVENGGDSWISGEEHVRATGKPRILEVRLKTSGAITEEVEQAILEADLITIGPGSLITSLIANLLFEGVVIALRRTRAKKLVVCNTTTQPGQTDGLGVYEHAQWFKRLLGDFVINGLVVNNQLPSAQVIERLGRSHMEPLIGLNEEIRRIEHDFPGMKVFASELIEEEGMSRDMGSKLDTVRHDLDKTGRFVSQVYWQLRNED